MIIASGFGIFDVNRNAVTNKKTCMRKEKEIIVEDLNRALRQVSRDAHRKNRALGLETLYKKGDFIIKLDSSGREHKVKKLEKKKGNYSPEVITFD